MGNPNNEHSIQCIIGNIAKTLIIHFVLHTNVHVFLDNSATEAPSRKARTINIF